MDRGAWRATVPGVTETRAQLSRRRHRQKWREELNKESLGSHAPRWPSPGAFHPLQEDAPEHPTKLRGPYLPAQPGPPAQPGRLSRQLPPSHMLLLTWESKIGRSQSVPLQRPAGTLPVRVCPWRDETAFLSLISGGTSLIWELVSGLITCWWWFSYSVMS